LNNKSSVIKTVHLVFKDKFYKSLESNFKSYKNFTVFSFLQMHKSVSISLTFYSSLSLDFHINSLRTLFYTVNVKPVPYTDRNNRYLTFESQMI